MTWGKSVVFISGASRGIGKEIFNSMLEKVSEQSVFLVLARNEALLTELKSQGEAKNMIVEKFVTDLGHLQQKTLDDLATTISKLEGDYDNLFVFHNAGSVGDTSVPCSKILDQENWQVYLNSNLISMILLNNKILAEASSKKFKNRYVINITSLIAIQAFPSLGQYGVGKAAREGFFRSLAVEESDLRILSYSPGPVDTDMHTDIHDTTYDAGIKAAFDRKAPSTDVNRQTLTTSQTVGKLMEILTANEFTSGSRIDYFD
ncbi:unnamed protein product [Auanema sp. JU1783]|nr:unnamed protein product [Auanema sp. JU1783]